MVWGSIYAFMGVSHTTLSAASYPDTEPRMLRYFSSETMWLMARNPKVTLPAYKMEWITATLIFNTGAVSFDCMQLWKTHTIPPPRNYNC